MAELFDLILKGGTVVNHDGEGVRDIGVIGGRIAAIGDLSGGRAAEVKRVAAATEARWATRLGSKKMKSLRALLEELAATVEEHPSTTRANGTRHTNGKR